MSLSPIHKNPVYDGYFADPFVWRHEGTYYAIGTGAEEALGEPPPLVFPLLTSHDFITWRQVGRALRRPSSDLGSDFWAPEVAFSEGIFYLYYSVGWGDKHHRLRVAISIKPEGPYEDTGLNLIEPDSCPFAIDAHPFHDDDGQWYLFYARDFLECQGNQRPGTALMAARLLRMTELTGPGVTILRATRNWQRFQAERLMYGGTFDWHTLEGPFVIKQEGKYYCLYSGGRWETESYGVDYGVADSVLGPYSDDGGNDGPRILRTIPGKVLGPGHNSVVIGPDDRTAYIVYHAWDPNMTARRMCIDELLWTPQGPRCAGPTLNGAPAQDTPAPK